MRVVTVVNAGQQGDGGPLDKPASDGGCAYYYIGRENRWSPLDWSRHPSGIADLAALGRLARFDELPAKLDSLHEALWDISDLDPEEVKGEAGQRSLNEVHNSLPMPSRCAAATVTVVVAVWLCDCVCGCCCAYVMFSTCAMSGFPRTCSAWQTLGFLTHTARAPGTSACGMSTASRLCTATTVMLTGEWSLRMRRYYSLCGPPCRGACALNRALACAAGQMIDVLKRDHEIRLNWRARHVQVSTTTDGQGVVVTSGDGEVIRAKAAIVTPSIAVRRTGALAHPMAPSMFNAFVLLRSFATVT